MYIYVYTRIHERKLDSWGDVRKGEKVGRGGVRKLSHILHIFIFLQSGSITVRIPLGIKKFAFERRQGRVTLARERHELFIYWVTSQLPRRATRG
jgi:hypothetical protein